MVVLPMYHIFLICTAIGSLVRGAGFGSYPCSDDIHATWYFEIPLRVIVVKVNNVKFVLRWYQQGLLFLDLEYNDITIRPLPKCTQYSTFVIISKWAPQFPRDARRGSSGCVLVFLLPECPVRLQFPPSWPRLVSNPAPAWTSPNTPAKQHHSSQHTNSEYGVPVPTLIYLHNVFIQRRQVGTNRLVIPQSALQRDRNTQSQISFERHK